jgi:PAS domain S-box-containing protein
MPEPVEMEKKGAPCEVREPGCEGAAQMHAILNGVACAAEHTGHRLESWTLTRAILDTAADGILTTRADGIVVSFNRAAERIFGYSADEVIGRSVHMLMPDPHRACHGGYMANYLKTGHSKIIGIGRELPGKRKDGSIFPMHLALSEVRQGGRHLFVGIISDLTNQKQTENALKKARDEALVSVHDKERFLAVMSHELQTPLHGVLGALCLLKKTSLDAEQRKLVDVAFRSGEVLVDLVQDVTEFSRLGARRPISKMMAFDLRALTEDAVKMYERKARTKGLDLACRVSGEVAGWFRGDPPRLRRVLMNLVGNAIENTAQGGVSVCVAYDSKAGQSLPDGMASVRFEVHDTGIGLDEEAKLQIFEGLSLSHDPAGKFGGGSFGLAICKQLVEAMGSEIGVDMAPVQGNTFWFTARLALAGKVRDLERT